MGKGRGTKSDERTSSPESSCQEGTVVLDSRDRTAMYLSSIRGPVELPSITSSPRSTRWTVTCVLILHRTDRRDEVMEGNSTGHLILLR